MAYPYEDLDDAQFERLVVQCMRRWFGEGVQAFASGKDGGRDALFLGTAACFPSASKPWTGTTVGQAKHTNAINAHFGDPDFSGASASSVLTKEIPRVQALYKAGALDNYILFSNRRLGGVVGPQIAARLAESIGIPEERVYLVGVERMNDMLHEHPELLRLARIELIDGPLVVSSYDIAEVIVAISGQLAASNPDDDMPVVDRVSFDEKNRVNDLSATFAAELEGRYLSYSRQFEQFLANPANATILRNYEAAVEDIQLNVIAHRQDYTTFDKVFNHLFSLLVKRDGVLARNKKLTRAVLFYMYWHCDIGSTS